MVTRFRNVGIARPSLLVFALCSAWVTGFILLLLMNGTNPVTTAGNLVGHISGGQWSFSKTPAPAAETVVAPEKVDAYDAMCAFAPHHADDLRALDAKWGKVGLEMSMAHHGSGIRMRRALRRLVSGERFVIVAIGGSITAGHGVNRTNGEPYPERVSEMLKRTYPNVEVLNRGIAGHGSDYFSSCYHQHSPTDADMYILETAINDLENAGKVTKLGEKHDTIAFNEILVRQLLSNRPDNAVMMMSAFAPQTAFSNAAFLHNVVSEYYDIPRLSMRLFMYPYMLQFPEERVDRFSPAPDIRHPNEIGHDYMTDILYRYIAREACRAAQELAENVVPHSMLEYQPELSAQVPEEPASYDPARVNDADKPWLPYPGLGGSALRHNWDPFTLPSLRLNQFWLDGGRVPLPEGQAFCQTTDVIAEDGIPVMRPAATVGEWVHWEIHDKHYWKATEPGAIIRFDNVEVHAGIVSLYYLRCDQNYGDAKCWIDDNKDGAVEVVSTWDFVCIPAMHTIAENVPAGKHSVSCEILEKTSDVKKGSHDFAIAAIASH